MIDRVEPGQLYCEEHKALNPERERSRANKKVYNSRWQKASKTYLVSHPLCAACLAEDPPKYTQATVVDHIVPHRGDRNEKFLRMSPVHADSRKRVVNGIYFIRVQLIVRREEPKVRLKKVPTLGTCVEQVSQLPETDSGTKSLSNDADLHNTVLEGDAI